MEEPLLYVGERGCECEWWCCCELVLLRVFLLSSDALALLRVMGGGRRVRQRRGVGVARACGSVARVEVVDVDAAVWTRN